jgi:hypothetical protein
VLQLELWDCTPVNLQSQFEGQRAPVHSMRVVFAQFPKNSLIYKGSLDEIIN